MEDRDGRGVGGGSQVSQFVSCSDHGGLDQPDQYAGVEKCTLKREKLCNQR